MNIYYGDKPKVNNNIYIFSFLIDEPFYSDLLIKLVVIKDVGSEHHNIIIDNINIIFPNEKDTLIYDNMPGLSEKIKSNENLNVKFMRSKYDIKLQICDFLGRYVISK